ncbi:MAG TPA: serine/threonine-protein kinase [Polyangia bacterium]|nr:serine/threonine-protein kinase [Polyangia bacterium]
MGKYKLHEIVGRGGMGVVYRGEHVYIGKEVAVKILHEGYGGREESVKRFLREARAASLINHPNIVDVTDFGKSSDGTVFFVMELLEGEALDVVLQRDRRLDLMRAITIVNQMAGALGSAHSKGIVHRDLKPENVMLIRREGRRELIRQLIDDEGVHQVSEREKAFDFVKILDFGVAKVRDPEANEEGRRQTQQGIVFGTPEYMAPETARVGISDPRTDIYALGIMFYEMLTGMVPFTGETPVDVMLKIVSQPVVPPREKAPGIEITPEAERLIMKALAKDPRQRHQSMEELFRDLQQCYGSVRYRRQLELRTPAPIPLDKRKPSADLSDEPPPIAGAVPAATASNGTAGPILLTKRKERKRTLPMDIGIKPEPTPEVAPPAPAAAAPAGERHWLDAEEEEDTEDWGDIDLDDVHGTR